MDIFSVISLFGGLAMFLYGMRLMGDSLKENSSGTLKVAMGKVTNNPVKAFVLGVLITALIQAGCFERICVMIQREVAERICAGPGSKDYGAFGLFVQWYYVPELLFEVPPHCFMPQPKVSSAVIRLTQRKAPPYEAADSDLMFRIIRAAFNQRRKTLVNALSSAFPEFGKEQLTEVLQSCGLSPMVRGEALSLADYARLSDACRELI